MEAIGQCMEFFERPDAGVRIVTDGMSVDQVVERIAGVCGLHLPPERRSRVLRRLDRLKTVVCHIRI